MDIYIEGNIGTGKTTFLNLLHTLYPDYSTIYEPVDQWTALKNADGTNLLENFYKDQHKWSFAFQMNSFISRIKKIKDNHNPTINFIERSVFTDKYCFANNCYKNGTMTKIEYDIYVKWHDWLCEEFKMKPTGFIYLKTSPEISHERINKRNRPGEESIPLDYLHNLHNLHTEWMLHETEKGIPVLVLDVSKDFYNDDKEKQKIISELETFVQMLLSNNTK
jgi:deoxyadenosine/deoxycytidine kinase